MRSAIDDCAHFVKTANVWSRRLAEDAEGVAFYSFHGLFKYADKSTFDSLWGSIVEVTREVKRLEEILLSSEPAPARHWDNISPSRRPPLARLAPLGGYVREADALAGVASRPFISANERAGGPKPARHTTHYPPTNYPPPTTNYQPPTTRLRRCGSAS